MNESIYYTVDVLHEAIDQGKQIRFHYFEWAMSLHAPRAEKRLRRQGEWYQASPWWLIWDNENYYLVAYDTASQEVRHYRVDKMLDLALTNLSRQGADRLAQFDPGAYTGSLFGMYHGQLETVRLRFHNSLFGVVIDRFGQNILLRSDGEQHFTATIQVAVSPQFFSWVVGFGSKAEILSPQLVRNQLMELLQETEAIYHEMASNSF